MLTSLITGGLLGFTLVCGGLVAGPPPANLPFHVDPDAARAVPLFIADSAAFHVDPDAALEVPL